MDEASARSTSSNGPVSKSAQTTVAVFTDPRQWPIAKRVYISVIPILTMFAVNFSAAIYAAAIPAIASDLHVSEELAISGLSFFALGIAVGPVIAGPISELFGRAVVHRYAPIPTLGFLAGCGAATNFQTIAVLRFFTGVCASPTMAVGGATLGDLWDMKTEKLGALMSFLYIVMCFIAAELGPVAGGQLVSNHSWRWTFWVPLVLTGAIWLLSLPAPETCRDIIERRETGQSCGAPQSKAKSFLVVMRITLTRSLHMLFTEPLLFLTSLYVSFALAVFYLFYIAYPYVLHKVYGFDLKAVGLAYLALVVGSTLTILVVPILDKLLYQKRLIHAHGRLPPEARMRPPMVPAIAMPISLLWLAWSARPAVHWICPMIAAAIFGSCQVLIFLHYMIYVLEVYGEKFSASALAATTFMRYLFSAAFPLFGTQMMDTLGYHWGLSLIGFISLLLLPTPWVVLVWGQRLRSNSKYAVRFEDDMSSSGPLEIDDKKRHIDAEA